MSYAALPILRTPRLTLRPLQKADAPAIVAGVGNYDVAKWLSALPYPYDLGDAEFFIAKTFEDATSVWAICKDDDLIGVIGIDNGLGYWLARPAWGNGYGFEAAHAVVSHCFDNPKVNAVDSAYFFGNERSGAILRALGFQETRLEQHESKPRGQDVDAHAMRLTRGKWERRLDMTFQTRRLTIRPLGEEDAADFAKLTVPDVTRNLSNVSTAMTIAEARADMPRRQWRGYLGFTLAIEHEGRCVGTIGIGPQPSLGYFLAPDQWGKGFMSEAIGAVLPEIFARFPISRIYADHFEDNPASGAILRKFGFVETGREMAMSKGRLEPAPLITYALLRTNLRVPA